MLNGVRQQLEVRGIQSANALPANQSLSRLTGSICGVERALIWLNSYFEDLVQTLALLSTREGTVGVSQSFFASGVSSDGGVVRWELNLISSYCRNHFEPQLKNLFKQQLCNVWAQWKGSHSGSKEVEELIQSPPWCLQLTQGHCLELWTEKQWVETSGPVDLSLPGLRRLGLWVVSWEWHMCALWEEHHWYINRARFIPQIFPCLNIIIGLPAEYSIFIVSLPKWRHRKLSEVPGITS